MTYGRRHAEDGSGRLVGASYVLPVEQGLAVMRATRIKRELWLIVKADHGKVWPVAADAAARAIAAGEAEDVVEVLIARAFGNGSAPAARVCRPRVRRPTAAEVEQWRADDAAADVEDAVHVAPVEESASRLSAEVAAWSLAAEKREGVGLNPVEVVALWAAVQARKAEGDPRREKSVAAEVGRMERVGSWAPSGTVFDVSLDVAKIRKWKAKIVSAAASGDTTEAEAKKGVGLLSALLTWASESGRVQWSLPSADVDGLTWRDALRLPSGFGKGKVPRPWWGSELAAILGECRGKWIEAAVMLAMNTGATQADFGVIVGTDVVEVDGQWFLSYGRAKVAGRGGVRVAYPLWPETTEALKAVGAWSRVGSGALLLSLPSGNVPNKDNVNSRHWGPVRKSLEASGALRKPRSQGDNGFRNARRTGAQRVYVAAPIRERAELAKAWLQQELIGGSASAYVAGYDSPMASVVLAAGDAMRVAGVFDGDVKRVGSWGRENVASELAEVMAGDRG